MESKYVKRCTKIKYLSREAALNAVSYFRLRLNVDSYIYKCPRCKYYHLTTSPHGGAGLKQSKK